MRVGPIHISVEVLTKRAGGSAMHPTISHGHMCGGTDRTTMVKKRMRNTDVVGKCGEDDGVMNKPDRRDKDHKKHSHE